MAEVAENLLCRDTVSRQSWRVGETIHVYSDPTVEGMIAGSRWINEAFMVIIIVPTYTKKDGVVEKAAVLLRTPAACSRVKLDTYDYPFPTDSKIKQQVIKAKGSHALLQELIPALNHEPVFLPLTPLTDNSSQALIVPPLLPDEPSDISDQLSVQLALSQAKDTPPQLPPHLHDEVVLDHLARELSRRLTFTQPASTALDHNSPPVQPPTDVLPPSGRPKIRHVRSLLSSSRNTGTFSASSTSRSSSTSPSRKVRSHKRHYSSRPYSCPFAATDDRHLTRPAKKLPIKSEERKYMRYTLRDLYNEYTTLKNFINSLRSSLVASPRKPYTSDLIWLQHHADYLDTILLHNSTAPWSTWNELIIDKLTRAFLELVVRVSPRRKYPDLLEEPVRKWMKRKRVGVASQYGPVPPFLAQAKVTDTGIEPKNGWEVGRSKDSVPQPSTFSGTKGRSNFSTTAEKK